jgi:hypothetical protein
MKLGANTTLGAAAKAVERKLCEASERRDAESMDRCLDMLRVLSDVEELEFPQPDERASADTGTARAS